MWWFLRKIGKPLIPWLKVRNSSELRLSSVLEEIDRSALNCQINSLRTRGRSQASRNLRIRKFYSTFSCSAISTQLRSQPRPSIISHSCRKIPMARRTVILIKSKLWRIHGCLGSSKMKRAVCSTHLSQWRNQYCRDRSTHRSMSHSRCVRKSKTSTSSKLW